jgi:xanthine dehydrogenase accessory factor
VVVCELAIPLTIRRTVAVSTAVTQGQVDVEGMRARAAADGAAAHRIAAAGDVAVLVSPRLPDLGADVVVDARLAKHDVDTTIGDASLVVGLGPGFVAGQDCHAVVETLRGHHLGRVLWSGSAIDDTGTPGVVGGRAAERVLRAPMSGRARWDVAIGDVVADGQRLGDVGGTVLRAPFAGVVRGLIDERVALDAGTKIGDIDPRGDPSVCREISDKALAIGGGVVEAVHIWRRR